MKNTAIIITVAFVAVCASSCCKQDCQIGDLCGRFDIEFADAQGNLRMETKGNPVFEVRLGMNDRSSTELKAKLYRDNIEFRDASLSWFWENSDPSIVCGAQNFSGTTSLEALRSGNALVTAVASIAGTGEVASKSIPVIVAPFTIYSEVSRMEDIYVSNVRNLGSSGLNSSEILSTAWADFNDIWDVHDFNAFSMAELFADLDYNFGVDVLREYYENGFARYQECSVYLNWNGKMIVEMFRQRIIARYGSVGS